MAEDTASEVDVVVVGGGIAGLCAGVRAAELGLRTTVIEKGKDKAYLCNSRIAGGVFHIAHEDIRKPAEHLLAAIDRSTHGHADPALARTLAKEARGTIDWLAAQGGQFINSGPHARNTAMSAPPRPLDDDLDWLDSWRGRGPDLLLGILTDRLRSLGGTLRLGTRATGLVMDGARCIGVRVETEDGSFQIKARAIVLCDGGFAGDPERLKGNITAQPDSILQRNAGAAAGDGLRMAEAAGAGVTPLAGFYGHVLSRDALLNRRLWPYPLLDELCVRGVVVDRSGQRFCDEGVGGVYVANRIAALDDPLSAYVISDDATWHDITVRAHVSVPNPKLEKLGGTIVRTDTIEELAQRTGLPSESLAKTIDDHNRAIETDGREPVDPPRSTSHHQPRPILKAPFLAIPACAGITFTLGGIRIDGDGQVLARTGHPIEGLYAAGSSTGGLEGGPYHAYVSGLAKAAVFGKHTAERIAVSLGRDPVQPMPQIAAAAPSRYPTLAFIVRHGQVLALGVACLPILALFWALQTFPDHTGALTAISLAASALGYLAARSYAELVAVIVDMLLPH